MNKRSEVVRLIMCYNNDRYGNGPLAHLNDEEYADYLLSKLEDFGMQPPSRVYQKEFEECFESIHYKVVRDVTDNTWEPEDELLTIDEAIETTKENLNRVFRANHIELENKLIDDLNDVQKRGW
jgi:hypothetical protein